MTSAHEYTSAELLNALPLTARQLQWWDERDAVGAGRDGHKRLYSAESASRLAIVAELRRKGMSLRECREILAQVRRHHIAGVASWLVICRHQPVQFAVSPRDLMQLAARAAGPVLVVDLGEIGRKLGMLGKAA